MKERKSEFNCKNILSVLLIMTLVFSLFQFTAFAAGMIVGDINKNGSITSSDALLALQSAVNKITLSNTQYAVADVDKNSLVSSADALLILQFSVGKISEFPNKSTQEELYYTALDRHYGLDGKDFEDNTVNNINDTNELIEKFGTAAEPSDVDVTPLTSDGKLIYNRISKEAEALGTLNKYDNAEKTTGTITVGDTVLTYSVPTNVTAYDAVPINYSLYSTSGMMPVHIEANTFEETDRYQDKDANYFDCDLPGKVDMQITYDGYVSGATVTGNAPKLSGNFTSDTQGNAYPYYNASDLVYSGTLKASELSWLKFTYKNTGNTILDGEGNGAFDFQPILYKKNSSGGYDQISLIDNYMWRIYDYCYPGESGEMWLQFANMRGYTPGDYRVVIYSQVRNERDSSAWAANYVGGRTVCEDSFNFTVTQNGAMTTPNAVEHTTSGNIPRNQWIGVFEEFMSSYNTLSKVSNDPSKPTTGTIYVQPAPFNETLVIKLMHASKAAAAMVRIPISVESDSISITLNPYNENYHIKEDGTREPLLATQSMVDMRGNSQMGPDALGTAVNDLKNMKDAGINLITTTMAFAYDYKNFDSFKFMMDAVRVMGFDVEAYASYPSNSTDTINNAKNIYGGTFSTTMSAWGINGCNEANAILAKYSYLRYGDLFWKSKSGVLPVAMEDTWGWMTFDHDWRFGLNNTTAISLFQKWLSKAYGNINNLNVKYSSNYLDFSKIDPRTDAQYESAMSAYNFTDTSTGVYQDWSNATLDLDIYRTLGRVENYKTILNKAGIDGAKITIRSEGSTWLAGGIKADTTNPHYRQIYYEQRRNAVIPEIIAASGLVYECSNYDGIPLTASETYEVTRRSTQLGITMMKMPMVTHWRDTVVNTAYGSSKYVSDWNLANKNLKVTNIDTYVALFPYLKAMYEGGGIPGAMWQDYYCDGYLTSTQYKELKFYTSKIQEMLSTEEGHKWATEFEPTDRSFESEVKAAWSYPRSYVENAINSTPRFCNFTDSLTAETK